MTLSSVHQEFIEALNHSGTKYLVVGGIAVVAYGVDRNTGDMDIWVDNSSDNLASLQIALLHLGFEKKDVDSAINAYRSSGKIAIVLDQKFPIEMMASFSSFVSFAEAFGQKKIIELSGTPTNVVDIDTLINMKIRAGREKDLWDASNLKKKKDHPDE